MRPKFIYEHLTNVGEKSFSIFIKEKMRTEFEVNIYVQFSRGFVYT